MINLAQITSDGLIKAAIQRSRIDDSDAGTLLQKVIADMAGEVDQQTVKEAGYVNQIREGIEKLKRLAAQAEAEFVTCGQTDCFGNMILEHKVPKRMLRETVAEVDRWMRQRAEIEMCNADELERAAAAQRQRASRFAVWSQQVSGVMKAVSAAGYDPEVMLYAEALKKT